MAALPTLAETLNLGDATVYLMGNDYANGSLFGERLVKQTSSVLIAYTTDALRWQNEQLPFIAAVNATGTITIDDIGNNGDVIEVFVDDPLLGSISLGSYTKQSTDTDTTILAASITAILNNNSYGYTAISVLGVITITSRSGLGSTISGGSRLSVVLTPTFQPTDIADLWAWYDAAEGVTGTTEVTDWADQSGNANDLTAASGEEPELDAAGLNNLPVIQKSASQNARMSSSVVVPDLATTGGTIFIVGAQVAGDTNAPFLTFGTSQSVSIRRLGATANAVRFGVNSQSGATNNDRTGVTDDTYHTLRLRVDNVNQYASINNDAETSMPCVLGNFAGGSNLELFWVSGTFGNKKLAEVIIYNRDLDADEILEVETYLQSKYSHY